jgi:hypothetical protein
VSCKVMTRFGEIEIRIHRYRGMDGGEIYPLERFYGIKGITEGAKRRALFLAVERSYGWSARILREEFGLEFSAMRLWGLVQREGKEEQRKIEELQERIFGQGDDRGEPDRDKRTAVVEIDGTMLATRDAVKPDEFGRKRMEAKVGVMFRGTEPVSGKRRKTVKRKVFGQVAESGDFGERLYAVFREHGLSSDEPVHVVADGATWIRNVRLMVFPRGRYTLDLYHLKERASSVLVDHQQNQFFEYIYRGKPRDGLAYLRTLMGSDRRHKVELEDFVHYVEDNLSGMKYTVGDINGSGVIEKMANLVVKKRMKRQGMTWSKAGANNIFIVSLSNY